MNAIDTHSESHFFFYTQAAKALQDMKNNLYDLSPSGNKDFLEAVERFKLARARAQKEFAAVMPLLPRTDL